MYADFCRTISARLEARKGQSMAEYAIILSLVAVACIAAVTLLGGGIQGTLGKVTAKLG